MEKTIDEQKLKAIFNKNNPSFEMKISEIEAISHITFTSENLLNIQQHIIETLDLFYDFEKEDLDYLIRIKEDFQNDEQLDIKNLTVQFRRKLMYCYRKNVNIFDKMDFHDQKFKVSKLLKESIESKNLNILIGSGCSLPAVPLMGSTFMNIKEKFSYIEYGMFDNDSKDIEGYLNWLNMGISFNKDYKYGQATQSSLQESFNITKQELISTIPKNYMIDKSSILTTKNNYINFYNSIFSLRNNKAYSAPNIFTTNYDLFNEVALEHLQIHYTNGFSGFVNRFFDPTSFNLRIVDDENRYKDKWSVVRNYIKLFKIHGSIDWVFKENKIIQTSHDENAENVVIYPTLNKHFETQQSPYSELFRALSINLQKPHSTLIILGYGFPDEHLNHLISQSLSNDDFSLIVFGNLYEENARKFYDLHKNKENFYFVGGSLYTFDDGHYFSNVINFMEGE